MHPQGWGMFNSARTIALTTAALQLLSLALCGQTTNSPDLSGATVTIPYSELRSLWEASQQNTARSENTGKQDPPVAALMNSASLKLHSQTEHTLSLIHI